MKRFTAEPAPPELQRQMDQWTAIVVAEKPKGQCRGCALRPGTQANRDLGTIGKLIHVMLGGGDFRCHHARLNGPICTEAPTRQCRGFAALLVGMGKRFSRGKLLADRGAKLGAHP